MEVLPKDIILKFNPDTLQAVRKEYNLEQLARINEAVDILDNWVKKQDHFVKKDFSREYLERTLISTKGLVERAKLKMDSLCTFRTIMPDFFSNTNIKEQYECLSRVLVHGHLRRQTNDDYRVYMMKIISEEYIDSNAMLNYYKYVIAASEYIKNKDYCKGHVLVLDFTDISILNMVTKVSPIELRQSIMILTDGYGMRIKGIHVITPSKMVDALLGLLKQVLSPKVAQRIHVHKTVDTLYEHVDRDLFPEEYGGSEMSLQELNEAWYKILSSNEYKEYLKEMNKAVTNETHRQSEKFNQQYLGMPGSFRTLCVD